MTERTVEGIPDWYLTPDQYMAVLTKMVLSKADREYTTFYPDKRMHPEDLATYVSVANDYLALALEFLNARA